jgi:E3 Ubiquitin ligase
VTFGFALLVFGIVALALGTRAFFAMKELAIAPFRRTGEIAKDPALADHRGMVSAEGRIVADSPARAPCSGRDCLYYEVRIDRLWEKSIPVAKGTKTESGQVEVTTKRGGARFRIDDGTGPLAVDARHGAECDLVESHAQRIPVDDAAPAELIFGELRLPMPAVPDQDSTVAFTAIERILPAEGTLYVSGKLRSDGIGKPSWASLFLSTKGRGALLQATQTRAILGLVLGGFMTAASIPAFLSLTGSSPAAAALPPDAGSSPAPPDAQTSAPSASPSEPARAAPSPAPPTPQPPATVVPSPRPTPPRTLPGKRK